MHHRFLAVGVQSAKSVMLLPHKTDMFQVELDNLPRSVRFEVAGLSRALMGLLGGFRVFCMPFCIGTEAQVLPRYEPSQRGNAGHGRPLPQEDGAYLFRRIAGVRFPYLPHGPYQFP